MGIIAKGDCYDDADCGYIDESFVCYTGEWIDEENNEWNDKKRCVDRETFGVLVQIARDAGRDDGIPEEIQYYGKTAKQEWEEIKERKAKEKIAAEKQFRLDKAKARRTERRLRAEQKKK